MMKLAVALSLVSSLSWADDPKYACKARGANEKVAVTVKAELSVEEFGLWVMGVTCKTLVFDAGHSSTMLKVMAPKEMTTAQIEKLYVDSLAVVGLTAKVTADSIVVSGKPVCGEVAGMAPIVSPTAKDDEELDKAVAAGITVVDGNHRKVTKALVDKFFANPMAASKSARLVPAMKDGKPNGFKLYAIRPSSIYAKLGLENGDTLAAVNGFSLDSADKALEAYTKLREATSIELSLIRRGKPFSIYITLN